MATARSATVRCATRRSSLADRFLGVCITGWRTVHSDILCIIPCITQSLYSASSDYSLCTRVRFTTIARQCYRCYGRRATEDEISGLVRDRGVGWWRLSTSTSSGQQLETILVNTDTALVSPINVASLGLVRCFARLIPGLCVFLDRHILHGQCCPNRSMSPSRAERSSTTRASTRAVRSRMRSAVNSL